jgi:hypothetical protein
MPKTASDQWLRPLNATAGKPATGQKPCQAADYSWNVADVSKKLRKCTMVERSFRKMTA